MKTMISILALAILATGTPPKTIGESDKASGSNVISCCNPTKKESSSGLSALLRDPSLETGVLVSGLMFTDDDAVNFLSNVGSDTMCGGNTVSRCSGDKKLAGSTECGCHKNWDSVGNTNSYFIQTS
ncbi:hypothetical protein P154DRAFT_534032 [Amniculicola lignicola CBS 123094]|uniref:Hydrophobin n=1 Tax=Amniculicola lignicola CBS 123094 TaxID=1392246 RepID=A0A6A5WJQ2_9PLEO|nr:hypothetical protein P154DRAFT_534032 [Amniculicola lignicola CBS 123094]